MLAPHILIPPYIVKKIVVKLGTLKIQRMCYLMKLIEQNGRYYKSRNDRVKVGLGTTLILCARLID
jgi:hypothetical protein